MTKFTLRLSKILMAVMMLTSRLSFIQVSAHGGATLSFDIDKFDVSENYTIDYTWELNKTVDPTEISLLLGGSQSVTYTVTATRDAQSTFRFTYDFDVENRGHGTAVFGIDVQLVNASGSMVLATKNITPSLTLLEDQTQSYNDTIVFTLSENIYDKPLKIQLIVNEISNVGSINGLRSAAFKFDDAPTHTTNESLLVSDDLSENTWTFTNTGTQTYTQSIIAGTAIGDHSVVNTVTGLGSDGFVPSSASASVLVHTANTAPVADPQNLSTDEDIALSITLTGSDPDGQSISFTNISDPDHGSISGSGATMTYTPDANYFGSDSFTFKSYDGYAYSPAATVTLTVNAINDAPVAANDAYSTSEDVLLSVPTLGVLANDSDVEGSPLTVTLVNSPSHGAVTLNSDGSLSYQPALNYTGSDSFSYRATDGLLSSNEATVSLTVNAINDAPVAVADAYSTDEDTLLSVLAEGVLTNDSDTDSSMMANLITGTSHGSISLQIDGSFVYTPNANYFGSDSFTYRVSDGLLNSEIVSVSLTIAEVNDQPVAVDDTYSTDEDSALSVASLGVLSNDTDMESDALGIQSYTQGTHGWVVLNNDGSFVYTPDANYNGSDTFTYAVVDARLGVSNTATVSITVNAVNDAPVAVNDGYSAFEDTTLTIDLPGVLENDTDVDLDPLRPEVVSAPSHGSLTLNSDGSFSYVPDANFDGLDSFTYKDFDDEVYSNIATVYITMVLSNDAPIGSVDAYSTGEDVVLNVNTLDGVLSNDLDFDHDVLSAVLHTNPVNGTLDLSDNGSFIYTPNAQWSGVDEFVYRAFDGMYYSSPITVTLTVTSINDAPVAVDDAVSGVEDTSLSFTEATLVANDTDVDGLDQQIISYTNPVHGDLSFDGTSFTYMPDANFNGSDSFTYTLSDMNGGTDSAEVTLTIEAVNDVPVAQNDLYSTDEDVALISTTSLQASVLGNDVDTVELSPLSAVLVLGPAFGSLSLATDGTFTYTPQAHWNGIVEFTYQATDGTDTSNEATVTLLVNAVNDAPVAVADAYDLTEDLAFVSTPITVLANDADPIEGSPLTVSLMSAPLHAISFSLETDGTFSYTPTLNYFGSDSFTYQVSDGTDVSNTVVVSLNIASVNDTPIANPYAFTVPNAGSATGLLSGSDVESTVLIYTLVGLPVNGVVSLVDNGFTYLHNGSATLSDSFTFTVTDADELTSLPVTVTITVLPAPTPPVVNLAPTADGFEFVIPNGGSYTGVVTGSDPEGAALIFAITGYPINGTLSFGPDGSFTYTHNGSLTTTDGFGYSVSDGSLSGNKPVVITILPLPTPPATNTAPVAVDGSGNTLVNTAFIDGIIATDADGDALTYTLLEPVEHGMLVLRPDGSFTYSPFAGYVGQDSFTFSANDGTLDSNVGTYTFTIEAAEVVVLPEETPLAALPVALDLSWLYWLAGLSAAFLNFLAFLRPNLKYRLITKDGQVKTLRRRIARPDGDILFIDLNDKNLDNIVDVDVMIYKRLAKHLGNVTVSFMMNNRIVQTITIPESQDEVYTTLIHL